MSSSGHRSPSASGLATAPPRPPGSALVWATPFDVVTRVVPARPATKRELLRTTRALEREALDAAPVTAAACLQDVRHLTPATRSTYRALAAAGSRVVLHARDMPAYLDRGVVGTCLDDSDPLVDVWAVLVLSAAAPVAFVATDLHETSNGEDDRAFLVAVSRDPDVVVACLDTLALRRVAVPGDLGVVADRLAEEFAGRRCPEAVGAVVARAARDLSGTPAPAWDELVERSARQRLLEHRDRTGLPAGTTLERERPSRRQHRG